MKTIVASFVLVLLLAGESAAQDAGILVEDRHDYDSKWALVIGINYADSKAGLELVNAENDAVAIGKLLKESYGFQCDVLLGEEATRRRINSKLKEYESRVGAKDCFLFYFAGHGAPDDGMPYLYPADVESEDGAISERLAPYEILRSKIQALHCVYIFDSCFSGDILNLHRIPPLDKARRVDGEFVFESRSLQILTSSASNQKAKDGTDGHSPFARSLMNALVDLIRRTGTDVVATSEIAKYIRDELKGQQPQSTHLNPDAAAHSGGDFLFIRQGRVPSRTVRTFVYQTLPGSYASLPGSPFEKTWFDEMPWLTPEMRLILDGEYEKNPRAFPGPENTVNDFSSLRQPLNLTPTRLKEFVKKHPGTTHVATLLTVSESNRSQSVSELLKEMSERARSSQRSSSELHLEALLRSAGKKAQHENDAATVRELFERASEGYHPEHQKGLRARCLADYASWLLQKKDYEGAKHAYEQAISAIGDHDSPEMALFRIELLAGVAITCRHLAKNSDDPRRARPLWETAGEKYAEAFAVVNQEGAKFPASHLVRAYLHERGAWLSMDLWEIDRAVQHFEQALSIRGAVDSADIDAFLSICHAKQGLAMAKRLSGDCGKDELRHIQQMLETRILAGNDPAAQEAAVVRLWNTTERLGDCDFFLGGHGMRDALLVYFDRGLRRDIDKLQDHVSEDKVTERSLRLCCKSIIAATLAGDERRFRDAKILFDRTKLIGDNKNVFIGLLGDFAAAFGEYNQVKNDPWQLDQAQEKLDMIRLLVRNHAAPGLDREAAELLMMIATAVADEQRGLDASVLKAILPRGPDGNPPKGTVRYVREQYDRIIMLQSGSDGSQVRGGPEFIEFVNLVQGARQAENVSHEQPLVVFYFPLSGRNGLLLMQTGNNSDTGKVHLLDFGWSEVEGLSPERIGRVNGKLQAFSGTPRIYWSDDPLLQLPRDCPFSVPGHSP